jgi:hypothetical protein
MRPRARFLPALLAVLLAGLARPASAESAWSDYQIIMWQGPSDAGAAALKRIGVTAGNVHGRGDAEDRSAEMAPLLHAGLKFFVENIATDFYSAYHRWSGNRPVNWRFLELKERMKQNRGDRSLFLRDPSLSDPLWQNRIDERLKRTVHELKRYAPLYYNLGDETGIADLTAAWDFDLSDRSLAGMRQWLEKSYGSLAALNAEWGTHFARWDDVTPMTTDEAMRDGDDNFAAWADFKAWMDVAFARALASGTAAVHRADANALAAIEGAQVPGTGGYDYTLLANAVDAMEMYDDGENVEIARSLNPKLILLNTAFGGGRREVHYFWRELLRGGRGMVLWDPKSEYADEHGGLGPRGRIMAPTFAELRGGLGALFINSARQIDPIAILYSPASIRLQWMLERKPHGPAWSARDAGTESDADAMRNSTAGYAALIEHMGLQHRFISAAAVAEGALRKAGVRILILPMSVALSAAEAQEIHAFAAAGGLVIADGEPARYDEHGRKRAEPALADLFAPGGKGLVLPAGHDLQAREKFARLFAAQGVTPPLALTSPAGAPIADVEFYRFRAGDSEIIALLRDDPGDGAAAEPAILQLPRKALVTDLRRHVGLGESDRLAITLSPYAPVILALADAAASAPAIAGPRQAMRGATADFALAAGSGTILHIAVSDPRGDEIARFASNRPVVQGKASVSLRLDGTDPAGVWHISVRDVLSGQTAVAEFAVTGR